MIQTRKTGSTISCLRPRTADRARLPVTMPRNSDSDMCRAGQSIASMQSDTGLDEHGRLHGVSDLSNDFADLRTSASNSWSFSAKERKRRWRILAQKRSQIRRQDKSRDVPSHLQPVVALFYKALRRSAARCAPDGAMCSMCRFPPFVRACRTSQART